ncbi:MAG: histidine kinase dimerization/phosphoacceptor domain -containing protein [Cypionkella sp.]
MTPVPPFTETDRLNALSEFEILDTDSEVEFDDIVRLASAICNAPISLVSLLDKTRQWFKAEIGLNKSETPLDSAMCVHAIMAGDYLEIPDTTADPRTAQNPLVTGEKPLMFYAGAVLTTSDNIPIGTLCVLDYEPKTLTPLQRDTLRVLGRQVVAQLELRRALKTAEMLRLEVDHRMKNSLQSLSSLVRLQSRGLKSTEALAAMSALNSRLEAVSTLHELLYQTDSGANVDLRQYVTNLINYTRALAPPQVVIQHDLLRVVVSSKIAVSVGTLLNEFIANAFKHAFPDGAAGVIQISMQRSAEGKLRITCADNGVGIAPNDPQRNNGIGMTIAEVACMELNCQLSFDTVDRGVSVSFEFTPHEL